jgi:hypothetical protein
VIDPSIERPASQIHDGRTLDVRATGPDGGDVVLFHHGTPSAGLPFAGRVELHGRLSLVVGPIDLILDELLGAGG